MFKVRASSLGKLMTAPKGKDADISVGAKTFVREQFKQDLFLYEPRVFSKYLEKGLRCEQDSIDLYNEVFFADLQKNTVRIDNEWLTGECDILTPSSVIDIKTVWSLDTFPIFPDDAREPLYEWQLRAYMMLFDVDEAVLAYCLVDTPLDLIGYEDQHLHIVGHIAPERRITRLFFKRDAEKEAEIIRRVTACREYYEILAEQYAALRT